MKIKLTHALKHLLLNVGSIILALAIIFQEWGWEFLKKLLIWLGKWPIWKRLSQWIAKLPPYGALASFIIPFVIDKLVELLGFLAIFYQHPKQGLLLIILSKIMGTALIAWIYDLTEPQLLKITWFLRFHDWWIPFKNQLVATLKSTIFWQTATQITHRSKQILAHYLNAIKSWVKNVH